MKATVGETRSEAFNCIENLLIREEIPVETYEALRKILGIVGNDDCIDLGEGIKLKLVDCNK